MPDDEPWKAVAPLPDSRSDGPGNRRYQRAQRLSEMARNLRGPLASQPHRQRSVAYWRHCVDNWQEYLDGKIGPPHGGRQPKVGNDEES